MPTVAVGSTNPTKIEAVRIAFGKVFPEEEWNITSVAVSSDVSDQPKSDNEAITGATNRAKKAIKQTNADFGVGLEGGMHQIDEKWVETGWIVVQDKTGTTGIGSSIRMQTPPKIHEIIEKGTELGVATDMIFKRKDSSKHEGFFGLMTNGHLDRTRAYADGVIAALTRFLHPELF